MGGEKALNDSVLDIIAQKDLERLFVDARGVLMIEYCGGRKTKEHRYGVRKKHRIVIPHGLVDKVLELVHEGGLGGHMGQERTWKRARDSFYWKNMKEDVVKYVAACERCGRNKHSTHPNVAPFQETDLPHVPLDHLQVDFAGPFRVAQSHPYVYVLQVQDVLSRFVRMVPCTDNSAKAAVQCLMEQWICIFGVPSTINSDRGTHFTSEVFEGICKAVGINHKLGAPKHPESQGLVERQNQLLSQVRCVCENNVENWPEAVHRVAFAHNIAENSTTGIAPFTLLTGQGVRDPEGIWLRDTPASRPNTKLSPTYYEDLLAEKEKAMMMEIAEARRRTREAQLARMEKQSVRGKSYKVDDVVRIKLDSAEVIKRGKKLAYKYSGKYRVVEVLPSGWTYRLVPHGWKGREKVRHFNDLKDVWRRSNESHSDSSGDDGEVVSHKKSNQEEAKRAQTAEKAPAKETTKQLPQKNTGNSGPLPTPSVRRSTRTRRNPERLTVTDMKAKRYDEVRKVIAEVSSDEEHQSDSSHDSLSSIGRRVDESNEEGSSTEC